MYDADDKIPREAAFEVIDIALYGLEKIRRSMNIKDVDFLTLRMQDIRQQIEEMR